jgi:hypothetical protein
LVLFAAVSLVYGFAVAGSEPSRPGLELITGTVIKLGFWAFCWIAAGVFAIALSILHRTWIGYVLLMPMPMLWAGAYTAAFLLDLFTDGQGTPTAWAGGLVWGLLVGLLVIIAGWPEPPEPRRT